MRLYGPPQMSDDSEIIYNISIWVFFIDVDNL